MCFCILKAEISVELDEGFYLLLSPRNCYILVNIIEKNKLYQHVELKPANIALLFVSSYFSGTTMKSYFAERALS